MGELWSPAAKWRRVARVEEAVIRARVGLGEITGVTVPENLYRSLQINVHEIDRIEGEETRHDVTAFLRHTSPQLPAELRPWWHHRLTSYDVQDTALFLCLKESVGILMDDLLVVMASLSSRARDEFKYTCMIGRTHLVHAEPITFGVKLANWYDECQRQMSRFESLLHEVSVGKLSGAAGMYTLDPRVEETVCAALGLRPIIATQIISRDIITQYVCTLANVAGSIERFCNNLRLMQQTEVLEVEEYFAPEQEGSSAMPHKRNPRMFEQISGLAEQVRSCVDVAMRNQDSAHERDLRNSSRERIFLADAPILLDYMLYHFGSEFSRLVVHPGRMQRNLDLTRGLIFSQEVQSLVARKSGLPRTEAYDHVKKIAQRCWADDLDFKAAVFEDTLITSCATPAEIEACFELRSKLKYVDAIFERVFGKE